jgi:hypothetical protein
MMEKTVCRIGIINSDLNSDNYFSVFPPPPCPLLLQKRISFKIKWLY